MNAVTAAVKVGVARTELRTFERPLVPIDGALLKIEVAGVCGSDLSAYQRDDGVVCVMGHENVGVIDEIGPVAASRWGVDVGDRVAIEEYLPCWHCEWCHAGEFRLCFGTDHRQNPSSMRFGQTSIDRAPSLWGGYAQYLYLPAQSVVHRVPSAVARKHGALILPIANGIQWTQFECGVGPGDTVLIIGPGQQGLGCVVGAIAGGATNVIVAGRSRDVQRLAAARSLGASRTIDVDSEDLASVVKEATGGRGCDAVLDTAGAPRFVDLALSVLKRKAGRILVQARGTYADFPMAELGSKYATVHVARGHSTRSVAAAIDLIARRTFDLDLVATHEVALSEIHHVLSAASDQSVIHVSVDPWR